MTTQTEEQHTKARQHENNTNKQVKLHNKSITKRNNHNTTIEQLKHNKKAQKQAKHKTQKQ